MTTARAFLDRTQFRRIEAAAARDVRIATAAVAALGYTFAPWFRFAPVKSFVLAATAKLIGRHAEKQMAFAIQSESDRISNGTIWSQGTPGRSVSIAGILPVGSVVDFRSGNVGGAPWPERIGHIKVPVPIWLRTELPPQPWRFRTKEELLRVVPLLIPRPRRWR